MLVLLAIPLLLVSCSAPPTYAEIQATAALAGCWPGNYPTPPALTVTPFGVSSITMTPDPYTQTATALPTTTPYPRCTPAPGEPTLIPWPTPLPLPPPYPTSEPRRWQGGSAVQTIFHLPGATSRIDLAVHPTTLWPVVAVTQRFGESSDPIQSFVRVFNPESHAWGAAHQVDVGEASNGQDRFGGTVVGVTGDGTIHVVWGSSDQDFTDGDPPSRLWTSTSMDYGATWSPPRTIVQGCFVSTAMATSPDGQIVVLTMCVRGNDVLPNLVVRGADGTWLPPEPIAVPAWYAADGSVVIVGDGQDARAIALIHAQTDGNILLASKRLAERGPWQVQRRQISVPGDRAVGGYHAHDRGLVFTRSQPDGTIQTGVVFMWTGRDVPAAYALISLDGGASWGSMEPIVYYPAGDPRTLAFVAPAYDPVADRLVAIWTCCADALYRLEQTTHYASWSIPGSGVWIPAQGPDRYDPLVPIVLGSRAAHTTVAAQAANSRMTWVAWVEQGNQVMVRSLDLDQVIPTAQYPTPTPQPIYSPTVAGGSP